MYSAVLARHSARHLSGCDAGQSVRGFCQVVRAPGHGTIPHSLSSRGIRRPVLEVGGSERMASGIAVLRLHRRSRSSQSVSHLSPAPHICIGFSRGVFGNAVPALLFVLRGVPATVAS